MFQFTTFPFLKLCIYLRMTELFSAGFPHSDICGSIVICTSPQLFAAYHVLHRLLVPRHSPCALSCLTFFTSLTSNVVAILHFCAVSSAWLKINLNCIYACSIFIFQAYRALALTATSSDVKVETANQNLLLLDVFLLFDSFFTCSVFKVLMSVTFVTDSGDCEIRTRDPLLARQVLSQLS